MALAEPVATGGRLASPSTPPRPLPSRLLYFYDLFLWPNIKFEFPRICSKHSRPVEFEELKKGKKEIKPHNR
jgi:hypothetical protein